MKAKGVPVGNEDLVVSLLRMQVSILANLLSSVESGSDLDEYFDENLVQVEKNLKRLRRLVNV